jgi:hypothetical protein
MYRHRAPAPALPRSSPLRVLQAQLSRCCQPHARLSREGAFPARRGFSTAAGRGAPAPPGPDPLQDHYNPVPIEQKWQRYWSEVCEARVSPKILQQASHLRHGLHLAGPWVEEWMLMLAAGEAQVLRTGHVPLSIRKAPYGAAETILLTPC